MPNKYFWAGASIIAIWLTVLFVGIYGPDFQTEQANGDVTTIPSALGIAFFAMITTFFVALWGFRDRNG